MEESNLSTCKDCQRIKLRKAAGTFDGKNKRWVDHNGRMWNGRRCPDCQANHMKSVQRKVRGSKCETK